MWFSVEQIRQKFSVQSNSYGTQIDSAIGSAARKIRRWVDSAAYAEAAGSTVPTDPEDLLRYETIVDAHAFLTMYYLWKSVGNKLSADGVIKQAQDSASPSMNSRIVTNSYLTPAELDAQDYYDLAWDAIHPYLVVEPVTNVTMQGVPAAVTVTADW